MSTILIVDDQADSRKFLTTLLGYHHHTMLEAPDGEAAFKLISSKPLDLVITDIIMPRMGGYELVKKMRSTAGLENIPVIFYTGGYRLGDAALLAINCGVKHVLLKPSDTQLILDTVNKVLNEKSLGSAQA